MTESEKHRLVIELDRTVHTELKAVAAAQGLSVRSMIRKYVAAGLVAQRKKEARRAR